MIKIDYDDDSEMMRICKGEEIVFEGSYWDFDYSPVGLEGFLKEFGVEAEAVDCEYSDGEWIV